VFNYLNNGIAVSGLGNLNGTSLGVVSIELNITAGLTVFGNQLVAGIEMYLVSPNGAYSVYLMNNNFFTNNGTLILTNNPAAPFFKGVNYNNPAITTYQPYGNLNSLNVGQSANGTWRLLAVQKNNGVPSSINSWKITFGTTNLAVGAANQTCATAIPLPNFTQTGSQIDNNTNALSGTVISDSKGSEVNSSSPYTETSLWYSFVPKCKDDKIFVTGSSVIQSGILSGTCGARTIVARRNGTGSYTYNITSFVPGNTYYLTLDGDEAGYFIFIARWTEGTTGCLLNTITTADAPKTSYCAGDSATIGFTFTGTFTSGNSFTAQLSDASGSFASPTTIGTLNATSGSSIKCKLPNTLSAGLGYKIRVMGTLPATTGSESKAFAINTIPATPTAINGLPQVCQGQQNQTYSVAAVPGADKYAWTLPSNVQLISASTDSASIVLNFSTGNALLSVKATNECGVGNAYSQEVTVSQNLVPSVSISAQNNPSCAGDTITFTATVSNGGTNPLFQWKANQSNLPGATVVYRDNALQNGDSVWVEVTSSLACVAQNKAFSNKIASMVSDTVVPQVSIVATSTVFCQGSQATFVATAQSEGTAPVFQWLVNKTPRGGNQKQLVLNTVNNKDTIDLVMQSSANCARPKLVLATPIGLTVTEKIVPTATITGVPSGCQGDNFLFSVSATNQGLIPSYRWFLNGQNTGVMGSNFASNKLANSDSLKVELTTSETCVTSPIVFSKSIGLQVADTVKPSVSVTMAKSIFCSGEQVQAQVSLPLTNGGSAPTFAWRLDGSLLSENGGVVTLNALSTSSHQLRVAMKSNAACVRPDTAVAQVAFLVKDSLVLIPQIIGTSALCEGSTASFQLASPLLAPNLQYLWLKNGQSLGVSTETFSTTTLLDGDRVALQVSTSETCVKSQTATSNEIAMAATTPVLPVVEITTSQNSICQGDTFRFSTTATHQGIIPGYRWFLNGQNTGVTGSNFASNKFTNGDSLKVELTTSETCVTRATVFSKSIGLQVADTVKPSVSVTMAKSVFCRGEQVQAQVSLPITNGGNLPTFAWRLDGGLLSETGGMVTLNNLSVGNHQLRLVMKSNVACVRPDTAGAQVAFLVKDSLVFTPQITGTNALCAGSIATFQLSSPLLAPDLQYSWLRNDLGSGVFAETFSTTSLADGDRIALQVYTSETCVKSQTAISNEIAVAVTSSVLPQIDVSSSANLICQGETVTYSASIQNGGGDEQYRWSDQNADLSSQLVFDYVPNSGSNVLFAYSVTLACGTFSVQIPTPLVAFKSPPPVLTAISGSNSFCPTDRDLAYTTDLVEGASYTWFYPSSAQASVSGNKLNISSWGKTTPDTLKVQAMNDCGTGNQVALLLQPKSCGQLLIPNAIITSAENGNALWQIQGLEDYPAVKISVFNRWGSKVFYASPYSKPWDGNYDGKPLPTGTYYYVMEGVKEKPIVGDLTILH
jgi:gliding motility-associated-like protein